MSLSQGEMNVRSRIAVPRGASDRRVLLLAALLLVFVVGQSFRPLTDSTEARYAEIAREMLVSGNWLIPTLDQVPHLTKPPFATWLMAGSMALFGRNEAAARLPGVLAFLATVLLVSRLAVLLGRREASGWAAFLFALSAGPLVAAVYPSTDTLLTFFETAAVVAYLSHRAGSSRARGWFFAAVGSAFLTKGPPGLLVPAAVAIGDRVFRGTDSPGSVGVRPLFSFVGGWLLFAAVGLGWYVAVAVTRPDTLGYWLKYEVAYRVFTDYHHRNQTPLVYLAALIAGLFPWWFLVPSFIKRQLGAFRSRPSRTMRILLAWVLLPLAVFVISRSRLPAYVLPLFPALCLALALERPRTWAMTPGRWFGIRPGVFLGHAALLALVSWASIPLSEGSSWKHEAQALRARLPVGDVELIVLSAGEAASLEFYLGATRTELLSDGLTPPLPGLQTVEEEAAEWEATPEGSESHLVFAPEREAGLLRDLLEASPTLVGTKHHHRLWLTQAAGVPGGLRPPGPPPVSAPRLPS